MRGYIIHPDDNVATALDPLEPGSTRVLGAKAGEVTVVETIREGHKVSLVAIPKGAPVLKYGIRIGYASMNIPAGHWVHLHNLRSDYDERSQTLDGESGAPTEPVYV